MTAAEHLIENAICSIENNESFETYASYYFNKKMSEQIKTDLHEIWMMAMYVVYTYKSWVIDEYEEIMYGEGD